jgi:rhodanese-related sulfurtransferase
MHVAGADHQKEQTMNILQTNPLKSRLLFAFGMITILLLSACGSGASTEAAAPLEIDVQKAAEMREGGAFVLDVREPEEWSQAHISGATLIPLGELEQRLSELPKNQEIVVYCRSGNRSLTGAQILRSNGFTQTSSMMGGINDWILSGLPTVSGP